MSIAGEVGEALNRGKQVGCECIQIFTKSSRQWASKPYSKEEIENFKRNQIETGITTVIAHDSYLVNLGAPDEAMRLKSVKGFIDELNRCEALGVPFSSRIPALTSDRESRMESRRLRNRSTRRTPHAKGSR